MRLVAISFTLGALALQNLAELPARPLLPVMVAAGAIALAIGLRGGWRLLLIPGGLILGFGWAGVLASGRLADALPLNVEGCDIEIVGVVASLPQNFDNGRRFDFDIEQSAVAVPTRISLAWYRGWHVQEDDDLHMLPALSAGERWHLTVRLKRPHGNLNPHGFDFEAWLFEQDIRATGYVRAVADNRRLDALVVLPGYLIERLRQVVRERFERVLGDAPYAGVLVALAIGDQRSIGADLWQIYARTGVTHLLSVSGLHVTMVAGVAAWLIGWCWRRFAVLTLRLPAQKAEAATGFLAALGYCLLAGFAVPAQRTLYMLATVAVALWSGRTTVASRVLATALLAVLLIDPWAVLSAGFWLSFGAVGVLFYVGIGRLGEGHWAVAWGRAQWAVTIGMVPAVLALFQQFSLVSPLANALAIPVVSLLVTPLALLGALPFGDPLLWLAHWLTAQLMVFLDALAASDWAMWQQQAPPFWAVILGSSGVAWLLMPKGFPARWLGLTMLLPMILVPVPRPISGEALIQVLDVGQGLAVHVQTATHDLLYDAGPAFSPDVSSGNRIIVPYLRAIGVRHLDALVISHGDKDHEGGAEAVLDEVPTDLLLTSLPVDHEMASQPIAHRSCVDGDGWTWDGVRFRVLHPLAQDYLTAKRSNDLSCVLQVATKSASILMTGDIEARNELALLRRHGHDIASDVVLPAHHGSGGSSTPDFISAVGARYVVFSSGYRNRFGHPTREVVARYRNTGAEMHRTDGEGAVAIDLRQGKIDIASERHNRGHYWLSN